MTNNSTNLKQKVYFIVTGASRNIGQFMAIECSKQFLAGSVVVLLARDKNGLEETKKLCLVGNDKLDVKTFSIDLSATSEDELNAILKQSLVGYARNSFDLTFIIHNMGSIGDITKSAIECTDLVAWQKYYNADVFSVILLNGTFMKLFEAVDIQTLVVNVSTKCSQVAFKSFVMYCTSRAAREMYFKVFATENDTNKSLLVLNYCPGVVDSDMTQHVQGHSVDVPLRESFKTMRDTGFMIKPIDTAKKLLKILTAGTFQSGDRLDYYDINL